MASTTQIDCKRDVVRFVGCWRNLAWKRRRDNAPPRGARLSIRADYGSASVERAARQLAGAALLEALTAFRGVPDSEYKRFILEMVLYVVRRDR